MLLQKFQQYVAKHMLFTHEDKILLTVSGGVDSMVMLALFAQSGYTVGVAHCNFQLRGQEALEDEILVKQQADAFGLPYYNRRFDTLAEVESSGESVQMVARRLRYVWFDELCAEHGYTHIALAHHGDDSAETFLINLLRGTGLRGLTGITVINGKLVRPLLFSTRKEIMEYATKNKIKYHEDSSNSSTKYVRNKIRLGVIPRIKEICPGFTSIMSANVDRLTQAQQFIDRGIAAIRADVLSQEGDYQVIDTTRIPDYYPRRYVIFELMQAYGFKPDVIENLCNSLEEGRSGTRFYAKDQVAYLDRQKIIVTPITDEDPYSLEATPKSTRLYCGNGVIYFEHLDVDDLDSLQQPDHVALLDESKLSYPLEVRRWKEGDTFVPFGMEGSHKKVSDLLIDAKVSLPDKKRQFVVLSGGQIVWVVGRRVDQRFCIDSHTEKVLRLTHSTDI